MANSRTILKFFRASSAGLLAISLGFLNGVNLAEAQTSLYAPGSEVVVGDRGLPDPLFSYMDEEQPEIAKKVAIKETEGCKVLQPWEPTIVSREHWQTVSQIFGPSFSQVGILAINATTNCMKVGNPAQIVELDPASGLTTLMGWFMPTGIANPRPEFKTLEDPILISAGLYGTKQPVNFVSGRVIFSTRSRQVANYAPRLNGARFITRDQIEAAIKDGTQVVDVRSKKQFDVVHIKGAIHVPYTTGPRMRILDDYSSYAKAGDAFDIRRVNPDRQKPVILIGEEPDADGVYRAAVVLRSEGWKKIFIFYE
jgi:rhodanese-related sulfurtransferase